MDFRWKTGRAFPSEFSEASALASWSIASVLRLVCCCLDLIRMWLFQIYVAISAGLKWELFLRFYTVFQEIETFD